MRLPTWDKPRVISCSEELIQHLALPRGCLQEVSELLKEHGIRVVIRDERYPGKPIEVNFQGNLRDDERRPAIRRSSTRSTRRLPIEVSVSSARHSRVNTSTTVKIRTCRTLANAYVGSLPSPVLSLRCVGLVQEWSSSADCELCKGQDRPVNF
jgi:hypothetical protein